jgi:hypothetical protein
MAAGFVALGQPSIATIPILQANQPVQQGANSAPTVYIQKIMDHRYGTPYRSNTWSSGVQATFTGWIVGGVLTVSAISSGALAVGQAVTGDGIPPNTLIIGFGNGTGGTGTYQVNQPGLQVVSGPMQAIAGESHEEIQQYETTFQISTLASQNPANQNQLTAADIANYAAAVLQSDAMIAALEAQGVGILRITDIRTIYFTDDYQRFEGNLSFDAIFTHKQQIITTVPVITSEEFQVLTV